jgi:YidC/Oxa1 family membrane protein insertase
MNIKEFIVPLVVALIATWTIQYFFFPRQPAQEGVRTVKPFVAPTGASESKPLNTEINFVDTKKTERSELTEVDTERAILVFSTDGASLDRLAFKRKVDGKAYTIDTVFPVQDEEREKRCFLVAFDQKTPYYFTLIGRQDLPDSTILTYRAETEDGILTKVFTVYSKTYKIDLDISISPKKSDNTIGSMRIFFPAPVMPELGDADAISSIVGGDRGGVQVTLYSKVKIHQGWLLPTLFGTQSRYFVHAMVQDPQAFCQRAYYKLFDKNRMTSILEGPRVDVESSWKLSFYFGPKELHALVNVDPRLESLEYSGLLGPIAKWFMMLMNWLYSFLRNYGLVIIALAIFVKLLLLPLTIKAEAGNKKHMELQKKIQYVKQRYKDDPERLKQEQAALIAKHGMPGLAGCLPLLLQLPIFYALSRVLSGSIDLYHASFLWIPDLAAPDPWYVLPVLTSLAMILAMRTTGDARQKISSIAMAIFIGIISLNLSSGLALYIFASTFIGVAQTFIQKRFA